MSLLLSHPTGNANVRAALEALYESEQLSIFLTCIASYDNNFFGWLSQKRIGREFRRRSFPQNLSERTQQYPTRELCRLIFSKCGFNLLTRHNKSPFCVHSVYKSLDRNCARWIKENHSIIKGVYQYDDGALDSFIVAKNYGLTCFYDHPTAYWRTVQALRNEESELMPEWACTISGLHDSIAKVGRKDQEIQRADHIIVASTFAANSLKQAPFDMATPHIIPYGCPDSSLISPVYMARSAKLKVLYVGGLTQSKGISYLFKAIELLGNDVELTVVGKMIASCVPLERALSKHLYINSLAHSDVLDLMRKHDVFVFPSLYEGFGLVLTEALSRGCPIITTAHTCAPDIIEDGKEGFIVPLRDYESIADKLNFLSKDRDKLVEMKFAALNRAKKLSWDHYRRELALVVSKGLSS